MDNVNNTQEELLETLTKRNLRLKELTEQYQILRIENEE